MFTESRTLVFGQPKLITGAPNFHDMENLRPIVFGLMKMSFRGKMVS